MCWLRRQWQRKLRCDIMHGFDYVSVYYVVLFYSFSLICSIDDRFLNSKPWYFIGTQGNCLLPWKIKVKMVTAKLCSGKYHANNIKSDLINYSSLPTESIQDMERKRGNLSHAVALTTVASLSNPLLVSRMLLIPTSLDTSVSLIINSYSSYSTLL